MTTNVMSNSESLRKNMQRIRSKDTEKNPSRRFGETQCKRADDLKWWRFIGCKSELTVGEPGINAMILITMTFKCRG